MDSNSKLEVTIDKILTQAESEILSNLKQSFNESEETLSKSQSSLEEEFERIIDEGKKESDKISKQIVGSADLESRNKLLILVQEYIDKVFEKAIEKISATDRSGDYSKLISTLIEESIETLDTSDVIIFTNSKDKKVVQSNMSKFSEADLSSETIDCVGGVEVRTRDGSMTYTNTIDSRIERMKPLLTKEIATKFGIGI